MTVYVDDAFIKYRGMYMSHMVADTTDELIEMIDAIGVPRKFIQFKGTSKEHFDISRQMRSKAVDLGAVEVSTRQIVRIIRQKRTQ